MSDAFKRQHWWKKKKLGTKWRKPRGSKNPMRRRARGKLPMPDAGYGSPRETRGRHPTGLVEVLVYNPSDLQSLTKEHIARIGGSVGKRKRMLIIAKAKELGIKVVQSEPAKSEKAGK